MGVAYRMLGSIAGAEDAVQDSFVRWLSRERGEPTGDVNNLEAYLVRVTTRLCLDVLKSAKETRESYVGPWLPEPLVSENSPEAQQPPDLQLERSETLSYAFMMLLELLNPVERAVYILREAFDYRHAEIASIIGRTEADSRQLSRRARERIKTPVQRFEASDGDQERLFQRFVAAAAGADLQPLFDLLAEDIVARTDGGGKVRAALRVLSGKARVVEFIRRVLPQLAQGSEISFCRVNGQPAMRQRVNGQTAGLLTVQFVDGRAEQLFIMRNPDKLEREVMPHTLV